MKPELEMNNDKVVEYLLNEICYIIDIFPAVISQENFECFSEIEKYFLQERELDKLAEKMINIVLKMACYHNFEIYYGRWYRKIKPWKLAEIINQTLKINNVYLNLLSKEDKMLITIHGKTLHISVYNPPLKAIANLSMLSSAEGLFMRRSDI